MGKPTSVNIRGLRGDRRAQELKGKDLNRVIVLAIDPARDLPKALICDYFGGVLEKPFFFAVNSEGISTLHQKVQYWANYVRAERVFAGIEVAGCYHNAIADTLGCLGYEVEQINSVTTAYERIKMLDYSKSDDKDLLSIAQAIIANNGMSPKRVTGFYEVLQSVCRARRQLVRERSAVKTQIRLLMTRVFREFQGLIDPDTLKREKVFDFWGKKGRFIMSCCPLPSQILNLNKEGLTQLAGLVDIQFTDREIDLLLKAAERALPYAPELATIDAAQVQFRLKQLEALDDRIATLELRIEEMLVQTPAILLLSVKGVGAITAAEFIAEIGSIFKYTHKNQLIKLAGTNPVFSQSGGKSGKSYKISRQGNPALRYVVTLIGQNLCSKTNRNKYFIDYYERLFRRGKTPSQIYVAAGNKFLGIAFAMLRDLTTFHVPGFEKSTSDILTKLPHAKKSESSKDALSLLTNCVR